MDLLCHGPARVFGLHQKGVLEVGSDADLMLVDLKAKRTVSKSWLASKCGWSPFEGMTLTGWPMATVVRGQLVMRDGQLLGGARGKPVALG